MPAEWWWARAAIVPCRSWSMSSMLSAPATMPPSSDITFDPRESPRAVLRLRQPDEFIGQRGQPAPLRQAHHRLQPAVRDQIPVIERGGDRRRGMGNLHLGSALLIVPDVVLDKPHHRRSQGTFSFP